MTTASAVDLLVTGGNGLRDHVAATIVVAVDSLLAVHRSTGIDLTQWPDLLPLVLLVYPDIMLEGTGVGSANTCHARTETGGYDLTGAIR